RRGKRWLGIKGALRVKRLKASSLRWGCNRLGQSAATATFDPIAMSPHSIVRATPAKRAAKRWGITNELRIARPTSKMSHAHGGHDSCRLGLRNLVCASHLRGDSTRHDRRGRWLWRLVRLSRLEWSNSKHGLGILGAALGC